MNYEELKAKGKSLDYIEGYIDGQRDFVKEEIRKLMTENEQAKNITSHERS